MSAEIVTSPNGDLYIIEGLPGAYRVRRVLPAEPGEWTHKHELRRHITYGEFDQPPARYHSDGSICTRYCDDPDGYDPDSYEAAT